ncbi:hypothetical protein V8E55_002393, partial [Tylopilus felleus]
QGTCYTDGSGSCGDWNKNSDRIVSLSPSIFGPGYPRKYRGQVITANGRTADGMVHDKCLGCGGHDLDMSQAPFEQFASLSTGVLRISWHFMPQRWSPS